MNTSFHYNGAAFSFVESEDFAEDFFKYADTDPGVFTIHNIRASIRTSVTQSRHHIIDAYTQSSIISVIDRAARFSATFRRAIYFSRHAISQGSVIITPFDSVRWGTYRVYNSRITQTQPPTGIYVSSWDDDLHMINILPAPTYSVHPDVWFLWERSVIHELVHALTGAEDPVTLDPRQHLGATETIAQRILSEMANPSYARITYEDDGYRHLRSIRNGASQMDAVARSLRSPDEYRQRYQDFQIDEAHLADWNTLPQWHTSMSQELSNLIDTRHRLIFEHTTFPSTSLRFRVNDTGLNILLNLRTQTPDRQGALQEATIEITYTSDYELTNVIVTDHHPDAQIPFGIQIRSHAVTRLSGSGEEPPDPEHIPIETPPGTYVFRRGYWLLQPQEQRPPSDGAVPPSQEPGVTPKPSSSPDQKVFPRLQSKPSSRKKLLRQHNIDTIHRTTEIKFNPDMLEPDHLVDHGRSLGMIMTSSTNYTFWTTTPYTNMANFERDFDRLFRNNSAAQFDDQNGEMMAIAIPHKSSKTSRGYLFFTAREIDDPDDKTHKITELLMPLGRLDTNADHSGLEYRFYQHKADGSGYWGAPEDDWHVPAALRATDQNILSLTQVISALNLRIINSRSEANAQYIALRFFNDKVKNQTFVKDAKSDYEKEINYVVRDLSSNVMTYITPVFDANYEPYYYESEDNKYGYVMEDLNGDDVREENVRVLFQSVISSYNSSSGTVQRKYGYKVYKMDPTFRDHYLVYTHPSEDTTPFTGFTLSEMFQRELVPNDKDDTLPYIVNIQDSDTYTLSIDNLLDLEYWNYASWYDFYNSFTWWSHISSASDSYITNKKGYLFADGSSVVAYKVKDSYYKDHTDTLLDDCGLLFVDKYARAVAKAEYNRNGLTVKIVNSNDSAAGSQSNGFLFAAKPGGMSRNVIPYDNQYFDAITNTNLTASEHPYFSFTRYSDVNIYFVSMSWSILQRDKNNFDLFIDQKQPILHDLSKNILALILHRMTYMVTTHVKYHEEL